MVVFTAREQVGSQTPTGDLVKATRFVANGAGGSIKCPVTLQSVTTLGRSICLILILISASGPAITARTPVQNARPSQLGKLQQLEWPW